VVGESRPQESVEDLNIPTQAKIGLEWATAGGTLKGKSWGHSPTAADYARGEWISAIYPPGNCTSAASR
jgi:hypothetical protein